MKYKIVVEWLSNDFITVKRQYDYTNKSHEYVNKELDLITEQLHDSMERGYIKTFIAYITT